jgi:hypothetical protein
MDASHSLSAALDALPDQLTALDARDHRAAMRLIARVQNADPDAWRSILVELMERPPSLGWTTNLLAIAYLLDERRTGRLKAWRQGSGEPTALQQARLRMLWLVASFDDLQPQAHVLEGVRVEGIGRNRYGWGIIDLLRQGRYELIARLAAKQLAGSSSYA